MGDKRKGGPKGKGVNEFLKREGLLSDRLRNEEKIKGFLWRICPPGRIPSMHKRNIREVGIFDRPSYSSSLRSV